MIGMMVYRLGCPSVYIFKMEITDIAAVANSLFLILNYPIYIRLMGRQSADIATIILSVVLIVSFI